jgi:hypothetical protein
MMCIGHVVDLVHKRQLEGDMVQSWACGRGIIMCGRVGQASEYFLLVPADLILIYEWLAYPKVLCSV